MDGEALEALRYFSDATHPQSFVTLAGRGPVLVSAPHAVLQTRQAASRLPSAIPACSVLCSTAAMMFRASTSRVT